MTILAGLSARAIWMASSTVAEGVDGTPVASAAARRSATSVARGEWMGARTTWSKMGKRIWVISRRGLSRRQAKMRTCGGAQVSEARPRTPELVPASVAGAFEELRAERRAQAP